MLRTIAYSQLDPDTKAYLREVRRANGKSMPGVFDATTDSRAVVAFLTGLVVLPLFLWFGYQTNKAPWAMAMLQTAGVVLGGWLMLYAVRRWTAGLDRYAGKFVYFDPEHVFVGKGEELEYARLDEETEAQPDGDSAVKFRTEAGTFSVRVASRTVARFVADYYDALGHLRQGADESWWSGVSVAELGAMARFMVVNERVPTGMSEVNLEVNDLPDEVRPTRGKPSGLLRYAAILLFGGAVFAGFTFTNKPVHDEGAFAAVNQSSPTELRHYLADPNTEAHHEEAKQKLKGLYAAKRKELAARPTPEADIREAFLTLLDTLDGPEPPAVSISVEDRSGNASESLRTRLSDGIGTEVGKEYILPVRRPGDKPPSGSVPAGTVLPAEVAKPAHIFLHYTTETGRLVWTLEFRRSPADEQPYAIFEGTVGEVATLTAVASEAVYADVMKKMLGNAPPSPPALPLDDW